MCVTPSSLGKTPAATGSDPNAPQADTGDAGALAVLLNPNADPSRILDAPGAGGDADAPAEDGTGSGQEGSDDPSEVVAEGEIPQEAEGRTPLSKDIKKQSEQFDAQRKEILDLFEDFGQKLGCSA